MIKLLRVDHRLLHGQVAFSWTGYLDADCILIANDDVVTNELRKTTIRLAKPDGVKLVMKSIDESIKLINEGVTDKYKLFIVVEKVKDAYRLANEIEQIDLINLGSAKAGSDTKSFSKNVNLSPKEEEMLKELVRKGKKVEIRTVPSDRPKSFD